MVEELTQEVLTREQIFEHLVEKPNVIKGPGIWANSLEMDFVYEDSLLKPYIDIIDTEKSGMSRNPKLAIPELRIHLTYSLNPINSKVMERVFRENEDVRISRAPRRDRTKSPSTYASREIRKLGDVDEIFDLAKRYHEIVSSDNYDDTSENYTKGIEDFADRLVEGLVKA